MSLAPINRDDLKPVFETLEEAFHVCGIDYYLIGALARDTWYARAQKKFRTTKDVDFAVMIGNLEQYEQVKAYLEEQKQYAVSKNNAFVVIAPDGTAIDLLPFGAIEMDDGVNLKGEGLTSIKVNGFKEVYAEGTERLEVITGHSFEVATLPAIVLLKLIAYDDRPEKRTKDARDIANILEHYFELEADLIYEEHLDLFADGQPDQELQEIAAMVIGREIGKIVTANGQLFQRIKGILSSQTDKGEESEFILQMVQETGRTVEEIRTWLSLMLSGLIGKEIE